METITIEPRSRRQLGVLEGLFREMGVTVRKPRPETLEGKMARLYAEGHYDDHDMGWFLSIPKAYRVDPFEVSPSGDVYYADRRNVDYVDESIALGREDLKEGRCVELDIHNLRESIRSLSGRTAANG